MNHRSRYIPITVQFIEINVHFGFGFGVGIGVGFGVGIDKPKQSNSIKKLSIQTLDDEQLIKDLKQLIEKEKEKEKVPFNETIINEKNKDSIFYKEIQFHLESLKQYDQQDISQSLDILKGISVERKLILQLTETIQQIQKSGQNDENQKNQVGFIKEIQEFIHQAMNYQLLSNVFDQTISNYQQNVQTLQQISQHIELISKDTNKSNLSEQIKAQYLNLSNILNEYSNIFENKNSQLKKYCNIQLMEQELIKLSETNKQIQIEKNNQIDSLKSFKQMKYQNLRRKKIKQKGYQKQRESSKTQLLQNILDQIMDFKQSINNSLDKMYQQIQQYIFPIQKEKQELQDYDQQFNYFEDLKQLSQLYSQGQQKSTKLEDDNNFIDEIQRQFELLFNCTEYFSTIDTFKNTKETIKDIIENNIIELIPIQTSKNEYKTPSLSRVCNIHKKEIIMIDMDSQKQEMEDRFVCVDCISANPQIKYYTIEDVNKQWKEYNEESDKILKEYKKESKNKKSDLINQVIQMRTNYNKKLNEISDKLISEQFLCNQLKIQNNQQKKKKRQYHLIKQQSMKKIKIQSSIKRFNFIQNLQNNMINKTFPNHQKFSKVSQLKENQFFSQLKQFNKFKRVDKMMKIRKIKLILQRRFKNSFIKQ
ncbi:unnamed protein product [Paramecium octaurelia]|uniref:Uncharacterized protein n=1 Tax=Paramecium octaurelia TaxID=43137 RepID=A0A8S1YR07_PAROT|nr:unnamed protein product [Paramecium octaurelia]